MTAKTRNNTQNDVRLEDQPIHRWYRFVLSFPPHLVREYINRFAIGGEQIVLDPFCGTGTTVVECKKLGISGIGLEANPMAHFASCVKTNWAIDSSDLEVLAANVASLTEDTLLQQGIDDVLYFGQIEELALNTFDSETADLLLKDSIDPFPLHKTLTLLSNLNKFRNQPAYDYLRLALARSTVQEVSNLHFGPEVGVRGHKPRASVIHPWLKAVRDVASDLIQYRDKATTKSVIHLADSRQANSVLAPKSIAAVITSPPYPNEKDYSRTTRLESVLLGFLKNAKDLRAFKQTLLRSNTRTVYKGDTDALWVADNHEVNDLANQIEAKRIELGKTSGFEKLYGRVTRLYFGGMARHFASLRSVLQPGAHLAYVVGDQASYFQIPIRTGQILSRIAENLGYQCESIDLFRTRLATATGDQLREEVLVLRWPGTR